MNINIYKITIRHEEILAHPALTSLFVVLFFALTFARLPALLYMIILAVEVYIAMFFGSRFSALEKEGESQTDNTQTGEESA
ncbi:MAG TPA: hypothetical protein EYP90_06430 [Chromatiaceae bacterium]|nr:hypothetical protein [Chromatiaceae bacterium]